MSKQDIVITVIALVISGSGIFINLVKKAATGACIQVKDRDSLLWFRILVPLALLTSLGFYFTKTGAGHFPPALMYAGCFFVVSGLFLRWFSILSLGSEFTVKVSILQDHRLKTDGVYRYIRHPSYTGLLIYYFGLGLMMQNGLCIVLLVLIPAIAVVNRIRVEEQVLLEYFGERYSAYQQQSRRLFPFLY